GRVGLLLRVEPELAVIHDPADRRIGVRLDLDQVEPFFLRLLQGLVPRKDANHFAIGTDHAHARYADVLVPAVLLVRGTDIAISKIDEAGRSSASGTAGARPRRVMHVHASASSSRRRETKPETGMLPRSSPERVRTATAPFSFSRSPTTSRYGTRCRVCSLIL